MALLANKNGTIEAVTIIRESSDTWVYATHDGVLRGTHRHLKKSDQKQQIFSDMVEALRYSNADASLIAAFVRDSEKEKAAVKPHDITVHSTAAPAIRQARYVRRFQIDDDCRGGGTQSAVCITLSEKYEQGRAFLNKQIERRTRDGEVVGKVTFFDALLPGGIFGVVYEVSVYVEYRQKLTIVK